MSVASTKSSSADITEMLLGFVKVVNEKLAKVYDRLDIFAENQGKMTTKHEGMNDNITSLTERQNEMFGCLNRITNVVSKTTDNQNPLSKNDKSLEEKLKSLSDYVTLIQNNIEDRIQIIKEIMSEKIQETQEKILEKVQKEIAVKEGIIMKQIEAAESKLCDELNTLRSDCDSNINDLKERFYAAIENVQCSCVKRVSNVESIAQSNDLRLQRAEQQIDNVESVQTNETAESLKRMKIMENKVEELNNRLLETNECLKTTVDKVKNAPHCNGDRHSVVSSEIICKGGLPLDTKPSKLESNLAETSKSPTINPELIRDVPREKKVNSCINAKINDNSNVRHIASNHKVDSNCNSSGRTVHENNAHINRKFTKCKNAKREHFVRKKMAHSAPSYSQNRSRTPPRDRSPRRNYQGQNNNYYNRQFQQSRNYNNIDRRYHSSSNYDLSRNQQYHPRNHSRYNDQYNNRYYDNRRHEQRIRNRRYTSSCDRARQQWYEYENRRHSDPGEYQSRGYRNGNSSHSSSSDSDYSTRPNYSNRSSSLLMHKYNQLLIGSQR